MTTTRRLLLGASALVVLVATVVLLTGGGPSRADVVERVESTLASDPTLARTGAAGSPEAVALETELALPPRVEEGGTPFGRVQRGGVSVHEIARSGSATTVTVTRYFRSHRLSHGDADCAVVALDAGSATAQWGEVSFAEGGSCLVQ